MNLNRNVKILTWFNFFTDFKLYSPVAILYFAKISGSFALGMSIFSISMISSAIFEIPTGIFSDFIGRKKTIILGAFSAVIFSVFYAIGSSYWILVLGAIFEGLSRSFYSGNNDAFLHDFLKDENKEHEYAEFLGKISSMFQLALAISAVIGSVIANWSFTTVMWLSVFPQVFCFIICIFLKEPKKIDKGSANVFNHLKESITLFLKNEKLRLLSLSSIISWGFGEASFQFKAAFIATVWPVWAIGISKMLSYFGAFISYRLSGRLIKKFTEIKILVVDLLFGQFTDIVACIFPSIFSPLIMSSSSVLFGASMVSQNSLFQKEFSDQQRATMGSLTSLLGSLFFGFTAFSIGFLADVLSPAKAIILFQILLIPVGFLYFKINSLKPSPIRK